MRPRNFHDHNLESAQDGSREIEDEEEGQEETEMDDHTDGLNEDAAYPPSPHGFREHRHPVKQQNDVQGTGMGREEQGS